MSPKPPSGSATRRRKEEAIDAFRDDPGIERGGRHFDRIRLVHRSLPEVDLEEVDTSCEFLGRRLSFPLLISSMTGGSSNRLRRINRNLAEAAQACRVAMGVGSQRVMLEHPEAADSFDLRPLAPDIPLMGNIGAVQLNLGVGVAECRRLVDHLQADALIVHCNALQEAVQPEGQTRFGGAIQRIGELVRGLPVPVVVKEVGAGMSPADASRLLEAGVRIVDVAGAGGTSWSRVEDHRRRAAGIADGLGRAFEDWGIPTPLALELLRPLRGRLTLIASGGVRSGVDMAKAVVLGASLVGLARPFLEPAMESAGHVIEVIERLRREFRLAMWLTGARTIAELCGNDALRLPDPTEARP